ncbi:FkbM family methyltransferase [Stratiformator vulcanicus]|uniref:FkbM family methyltransferase n=1 Tax=Stratiformator vulcanicus TaxID=2527980 RepID=UPI0028773550|nr:FkbM family methyltransferase [Stratiformator vulcanicus]
MLRRPYRVTKRLSRPFVLPVVTRLREHLLGELRAELQRDHAELRETFKGIQGELARVSAEISASRAESRTVGARTQDVNRCVWGLGDRLGSRIDQIQSQQESSLQCLSRVEEYSLGTARRLVINCGDDGMLVRTAVGYLFCDSGDFQLITHLLEAGELERGTRLVIERYLRPADTFVDVGANIGIHTLAAGAVLKGSGRIFSFEPSPRTFSLLKKSIHLNSISRVVELHEAAVSDNAGEHSLHFGDTCGHHSLFPVEASSNETVNVKTVRLDDVLGSTERVDLIKVDVEGAELSALRGASGVITKNRDVAMIVEYGPSHLRRLGQKSTDWFDAFTDAGLIFKAINEQDGTLFDTSIEELESVPSVNLFFARPESSAWERAAA